jgi:chorismate mutase/prephenate dehydrogenase
MSQPDDPLPPLRDAIADLDRALLELLRRRMDVAGEVGRVKAERNAPIVVRDVEHRVLARARQQAASCGVSEEVLESIFRAIIRGSVERQHRVGVELRARHGERLLIVGAAGGMGRWFRAFFELAGHRCDLPTLAPYAAVLVAVPLAYTPAVVNEVVGRCRDAADHGAAAPPVDDGAAASNDTAASNAAPAAAGLPPLVIEISSIKAPLAPLLTHAAAGGARVVALHPMFGPGKSPYEPLVFVLAQHRGAAVEQAEVEPFLSHPYTRLVTVPFLHHDRLMGWLLGLSHLTNLLFGTALSRSGMAPAELHDCASTTFLRQAATARSVLGEDPDLYLDIQRLNPFRSDVYRAAREALLHLEELVETGDRSGWQDVMAAARRTLPDEP